MNKSPDAKYPEVSDSSVVQSLQGATTILSAPEFKEVKQLKVATYNVEAPRDIPFTRTRAARFSKIAEAIVFMDLDVVHFQEIVLVSDLKTFKKAMPGYTLYYVPLNRYMVSGGIVTAVKNEHCLDGQSSEFYSYKIKTSHPPFSYPWLYQRAAAIRSSGVLLIETKLGKLINTHLAAVLHGDRSRPDATIRAQVEELIAILRPIDGPIIFGGDLNTPPNLQPAGPDRVRDPNRNVVESLAKLGLIFSHSFMNNESTAHGPNDLAMFDHLGVRGFPIVGAGSPIPAGFHSTKVEGIDSKVMKGKGFNALQLSDHLPVVAVVRRSLADVLGTL